MRSCRAFNFAIAVSGGVCSSSHQPTQERFYLHLVQRCERAPVIGSVGFRVGHRVRAFRYGGGRRRLAKKGCSWLKSSRGSGPTRSASTATSGPASPACSSPTLWPSSLSSRDRTKSSSVSSCMK